ncbi:hypothetical protein PMAYCL1PPCAC_28399, partial [Pristionchus mayeri]
SRLSTSPSHSSTMGGTKRKQDNAPHGSPKQSCNGNNLRMEEHAVGRHHRADILGKHEGFRGCTIWFTGLSGAGKTTVSFALEETLTKLGIPCYGLDGDNVRHGLCKNLGFSDDDRAENIRRVAELAKLFADAGMVSLTSFISPFCADRDGAREIHNAGGLPFFEVYVNTPLEVCESRDPKDLYKKARKGQIKGMTGIDSAYEPPKAADLIIQAGQDSKETCVQKVIEFLVAQGIIPEKALAALAPPVRELTAAPIVRPILEKELKHLEHEVPLDIVELQWLQVLAEGWATPLYGFMRERQYLQSLHFGQMLDLKKKCVFPGEEVDGEDEEDAFPMGNAVNQSIPIVLTISAEEKAQLTKNGKVASTIALSYEGKRIAVLRDGEIFEHRRKERAARQFGSIDERHPGVAQILNAGEFCLGGDIEVLDRITFNDGLDKFRFTPLELRKKLEEKQADAVFVFQLRNPIHNGHALLMKETRAKLLEEGYANPVLLLHPLGGWTKDDDVPLDTRILQHQAVIEEGLLGADWTVLSIFPSPMLYGGPTEVQWHARARLAAGVHTYIVGRDPAGIADPASPSGDALYEVTHGAKVLSMAPGLSHLNVVPFRVAAYDKKAHKMAMFDPSRKEDFEFISGTKMRGLARSGQTPPDGFMAPKAWDILAGYYKNKAAQQQ